MTAIAVTVVLIAAAVWVGWEVSGSTPGPRWKAALPVTAFILVGTAILSAPILLIRRKHKQVFRFKCNACGYPRRGLSRTAPCPECGAPASPR